jgi:hypothetical protein
MDYEIEVIVRRYEVKPGDLFPEESQVYKHALNINTQDDDINDILDDFKKPVRLSTIKYEATHEPEREFKYAN